MLTEMTRPQTHNAYTDPLVKLLRHEFKLSAVRAKRLLGYDLLVNERARVSLRVAHPSYNRHPVVAGRNRVTYEYHYRMWIFNFHRHGARPPQFTDFFVCIPVTETLDLRDHPYIIPWDDAGPTFAMYYNLATKKPYRGRHRDRQGNWEPLQELALAA